MKSYQKIAVIVLALGILFSDGIMEHFQFAQNPLIFGDDARSQIPVFYQYQDDGSRGEDYIADYFLRVFMPLGYKTIMILAAKYWDAASLSKLLPYLEFILLAAALGAIGWKIGGPATCFATLALTLSSGVFFVRMIGGLPRSFGFPLLAMALAAVVYGRAYLLAGVTLLGSLFYPVVTVISGSWLALLLLVTPEKIRENVWSLKKRFTIVLLTAVLSAGFVLPQMIAGLEYGDKIKASEIEAFPEITAGAYPGTGDLPPFRGFFAESTPIIFHTLLGTGDPFAQSFSLRMEKTENAFDATLLIVFSVCIIVLAGGLILITTRPAVSRLALTFPGVLFCHSLALAFFPYFYLPARYVIYAIPLYIVILFPAALHALAGSIPFLRDKPWRISTLIVSVVAVFLLLLGGKGNGGLGYTVRILGGTNLFSFISKLPPDSMIAGWPLGMIDNVSYISKRKTYLNHETHQATQKKYALEMRRRMNALIDVFFALDSKPLQTLRDQDHVDYLIIDQDRAGFYPFAYRYHWPYRPMIQSRAAQAMGREYIFSPEIENAVVFREGVLRLIDLRKIGHPAK